MKPRSGPQRGFTLMEVVAVAFILSVVFGTAGALVSLLAEAGAKTTDDWNVFERAEAAVERIRRELATAVQNPEGVTSTPAYAVGPTSITFRPPIGVVDLSDPSTASLMAAGRVSTNGVLYADYAKTIAYDANAGTLTLSVTGTLPTGMKRAEVLATSVAEFAFFDGESRTNPPADPTSDTWVIGFRLELQAPSASAKAKGANVSSSLRGATLLGKVLVAPETLTNTRAKPAVGP